MKSTYSILITVMTFLFFITGNVHAQTQFITNHNPLFMPATAKPAVGVNVIDPVFGTTVKRVTNAFASGNAGTAPQYSKRQAWNANDSLMLLLNCDDGYFSLYDGQTGQFIRPLDDPAVGGEDVFWHPSDKFRIIYAADSILYSYDIRTNVRTVLHVFTAYTWINSRGEGNISGDGRYYAFIGQNYNYATEEVTFTDIVVYDLVTDQIISTLAIPHDSTAGAIDWLSISPSGNYVVVDHSDSDSARNHGVEVYDRNLNFLWQRPVGAGHSDLGPDFDNQDVLVKDVYGEDSNVVRIIKYRLANGDRTTLLTVDWTFDMHISCRNVNRPGYCYISTFDYVGRVTDDSLSWLPFEDEIFALKMDGSGYTQRIAHHHSRRFSPLTPDPDNSVYWAEPHATVNKAGTKVLWGSNWRQDMNLVTSVDTYLCDFSSWLGVPSQVTLGNIVIGSGQTTCYNAVQTITVAGNGTTFNVLGGGSVNLVAGSKITMFPGTKVFPAGYLHAKISGTYCNNPSNPVVGNPVNGFDQAMSTEFLLQDSRIKVWPNPAEELVFLDFSKTGAATPEIISLYNIHGMKILEEKSQHKNRHQISLSGLPAGVYLIRILSENYSGTAKIVKR